jgi:hypothetical protein
MLKLLSSVRTVPFGKLSRRCGVVWCGVLWCKRRSVNDTMGDGSAATLAARDDRCSSSFQPSNGLDQRTKEGVPILRRNWGLMPCASATRSAPAPSKVGLRQCATAPQAFRAASKQAKHGKQQRARPRSFKSPPRHHNSIASDHFDTPSTR